MIITSRDVLNINLDKALNKYTELMVYMEKLLNKSLTDVNDKSMYDSQKYYLNCEYHAIIQNFSQLIDAVTVGFDKFKTEHEQFKLKIQKKDAEIAEAKAKSEDYW